MATDPQVIQLIMQLRQQGVTDAAVLSAIEQTPREMFVPEELRGQAYANKALPIEGGQTISQPYVVGIMTQKLSVNDRHRVLEVGTGSGYQTAVLSRLARRVYTIERNAALLAQAERRFAGLKISNITTRHGDGLSGWPELAPFDRIIVTAAAREIPESLTRQLSVNGQMIIPVDYGGSWQNLVRVERTAEDFEMTDLMKVRFVPLLPGVVDA
jgi:protein-L-isoaspartate(D-aspartate) O-methyltransferase